MSQSRLITWPLVLAWSYAEAGIGALVTQFETNPNYGPKGIALLAKGSAPAKVLDQLLDEDNNFEGQGIEMRQVAIVNRSGDAAAFTGEVALNSHWAGSRHMEKAIQCKEMV